MKRLHRQALSSRTLEFLRRRTTTVTEAADPCAEAKRLWSRQANQTFREIREALARMATGLERCMYCEDSEGTAIDHFWPKAAHPHRAFDWLNYLIACSRCNSNFKRDQFPLDDDGLPLLVNPAEEEPLDHLLFSPSTGRYEPQGPKGGPTIEVFGLNRAILTKGRWSAWFSLERLLVTYRQLKRSRREDDAEKIQTVVQNHPFAGVLTALLRMSEGPDAELLVSGDCLRVLQEYPEIRQWV